MKGKNYFNLVSIIFNLVETLLLIGAAYLLKISVRDTILIFLTFQIARAYFKFPKHYKAWQQCMIWTLIIFSSLFCIVRVDIVVGIMCAAFTAYILSGKSDIKDIYMWKKTSAHQDIMDYVKYNYYTDDAIREFERKLQDRGSALDYKIWEYRFKNGKSFEEISELLDLDSARIAEIQNSVALSFRLCVEIKNI